MTYTPQPGDIFLASSNSRIGGLVRVMQAIIGDYSLYTHCGIVLEHLDIVEAMPDGARVRDLSEYSTDPKTIYSSFNLTDKQRADICAAAMGYVGTKYSWADYLYMAMNHWGLGTSWIKKHIASSRKMICSQLVTQCYTDAGIDLFTDGRTPEDVTPGDLANLFLKDNV